MLALWAAWKQRGAKSVSPVFVIVIMLAASMLAVTGYKGGEVVYRHGPGVMRLPEVQGDGGYESHSHTPASEPEHHDDEHDHGEHHH